MRQAVRSIGRSRGLAAVIVLTLALGIGGATALFSVANGVLLRPLPIHEQNRVVVSWRQDVARQLDRQAMREDVILDYARDSRVYSSAGAVISDPLNAPLLIDNEITYAQLALVSGNYFNLLGAEALVGRVVLPEDDVFGAEPVAVLGEGLWRRLFGGDPAILGKTVRFLGRERTIVGVMPQSFGLPLGAELWAPTISWAPSATQRGQFPVFALVGRLAPGVTLEQATADFTSYLQLRAQELPDELPSPAADMHEVATTLTGDVRPVIAVLGAASALLLLIACFNVANLLLMRGITRQREYAVLAALGAGRGRIVRQGFLEALVLAAVGGLIGALVAWAAIRALVAVAPPELPRLSEITMDLRVLMVALGASLVAAVIAGMAPALWAGRADPGDALRGTGRTVTAGAGMRHLRRAFVVGQFALTMVILTGAGLLSHSLLRLTNVPLGFRTESVTEVALVSSAAKYDTPAKMVGVIELLLARARQVPGIESATAVALRPMVGAGDGERPYLLEGQSASEASGNPAATTQAVDGAFVTVLDIPVRSGRAITEDDRQNDPYVLMVSSELEQRLWPDEGAVGRKLAYPAPDGSTEWREIVGVVGDTRYRHPTIERPAIYVPWRQISSTPLTFLLRTELQPAQLRAALLPALREVETELWLPSIRPLAELTAQPLVAPRFQAMLLSAFAWAALFLAAIGIYGLTATAVAERRTELSVRLTLGAKPEGIFRMILAEGLGLALAGTLIGLAAAFVLMRWLGSLLYDLEPGDPLTFAAVTLVLLTASALACAVPAIRAARTAPAVVLRG
ncbi:MAG TPA: ABC transporter permease [Gemmatimonadales bacterium]|nr:ABC transporter permease [Gemmatimonadales bacterium]